MEPETFTEEQLVAGVQSGSITLLDYVLCVSAETRADFIDYCSENALPQDTSSARAFLEQRDADISSFATL